ncbi:MAG: hypothetical protein OEV01_03580 [Nitrospira sp.]|nr:hypothetical protein [Nitrospira sp.]MDH4303507.1 hypothetical protein [Nitrospira sp.]MDH5192873.1 hypothetical protein [Nitrospira sp.]
MTSTLNIIGVAVLALIATGCSTTQQQGAGADGREYTPPTSIYNILDSTALVYSSPAAGSAVSDHPLRWLGFVAHPIGHAFDYVINRPIYRVGAGSPYLHGYTAEDSMLDAQRQ